MNDMIGQFGVGFYSGFLVANKMIVTTKHNDDDQYIWESDSSRYTILKDPRGDTLKRGTTISLHLKDEAADFIDQETIRNLIKKYSQFINFKIYMWSSKTIEVEDEEVEKPEEKSEEVMDDVDKNEDEDVEVEEASEESENKKKKTISKTVWDWELLNDAKPIWSLKPTEVSESNYTNFYKTLTGDTQEPLAKVHFNAEGEVSFKALLFIPKVQPGDSFNKYGTKANNIKLYVRRVFITDTFNDMMPNYLSFIRGIVDSDDLPLNISRENLQQHKLIKVIKKKLVRKVLDILKKLSKEDAEKCWREYSTNIKLGIMEDNHNRGRLAKLLHFKSSKKNLTNLIGYVDRMKPTQKAIFYVAGSSENEVKNSPFIERLIKKGYEVLYLAEAVDEYTISAIPLFEGKKFQNVAKEGFTLDDSEKAKEKMEELKSTFEPLTKWLSTILSDHISKAVISERLTESPCALVASMFGWTGNMERLAISNAHQKADDPQKTYYLNQKKTFEINPRHSLIRELLRRVELDTEDPTAKDIALMMFNTATLRSGYMLKETSSFAKGVELLMKTTLGIPLGELPEEDVEEDEEQQENDILEGKNEETGAEEEIDAEEEGSKDDEHDEL